MSAGLAGLSNNFDAVSTVLTSVIGIGAARYFGNLATSTARSSVEAVKRAGVVKAEAVSILDAAKADEQAAIAVVRKTTADKAAIQVSHAKVMQSLNEVKASNGSAVAEVQVAQAVVRSTQTKLAQIEADKSGEVQVLRSTKTEQARAASITRMAQLQQASAVLTKRLAIEEAQVITARSAAISAVEAKATASKLLMTEATVASTVANKAQAISTDNVAAAQARLAAASGIASRALALVGGPVGFAMLAAGGMYALSHSLEEGKTKAREFSTELPELISNLEKLNKVQAEAAKVKLTQNIRQLKDDALDAGTEIKNLEMILSKTKYKFKLVRQSTTTVFNRFNLTPS